jgi:hypothetical protein
MASVFLLHFSWFVCRVLFEFRMPAAVLATAEIESGLNNLYSNAGTQVPVELLPTRGTASRDRILSPVARCRCRSAYPRSSLVLKESTALHSICWWLTGRLTAHYHTFLSPLRLQPLSCRGRYFNRNTETFYFLVLHPVACNLTILNESTSFRNQIMCVLFIILHCTTCFGL